MDDNHVFYEHQYGFGQNHSTQQAIITLVDKITTSLDKSDIIISVFLDLKKTFDTVDHHIYLRSYMHMVYVDTLINGLKVIYTIALSTSFIIMNTLRPTLLNVVLHKDLYWVPYSSLYT